MGNGASIINAHEGPYSAKRVFTFQPGWGVQMPSQMEEVEGKMYMPLAPGALVGCGHSPTPIDLKFFKQLSFFCKTSKAGKFGLEMKNRAGFKTMYENFIQYVWGKNVGFWWISRCCCC